MNAALNQLDQVTQTNATAAEEMAGTSEELASQSVMLQQTIGFFRVDNDRGKDFEDMASAKKEVRRAAPVQAIGQASNGAAGGAGVPAVRNQGIQLNLDDSGNGGDSEDSDYELY